ncbi:hypothetical protein K443DRAFT_135321 [Laccaria amethystina LaAM-08-1]|uniref:Adenylate cyclase n=1 Tax=Laccaria amethystina LaAM-08-1 TaxID=1095629 RepID=A0A0C9WNV7_9AGAR|nr:hypothetical protein K443DRAFT_135321 [Laccaria amethystina LaAM-08-1]
MDYRKVSPKTVIPPGFNRIPNSSTSNLNGDGPGSSTWTPPESWAVEKEEGGDPDAAESSSDDSVVGGKGKGCAMNGDGGPKQYRKRKQVKKQQRLSVISERPYRIRIYRTNNTYHVFSIPFNVTVAALTPALNKKLLLGNDRVQHRLYLKERGRERILAQTEKPVDIVRRRMEQAGYDPIDGLELFGEEGLSFLLKFVYQSQLLGPAEEELNFNNTFDFIDLAGRSLRMIPVILHQHAHSIVSLKLSRNPMLEIPLDFIQSCSILRELCLSNMAMKKVPQSVRHSTTLHRLDLSSNRLADLEDAYLEQISGLLALYLQNNRIEKLPFHFPRLRSLTTLNLSNNKFQTLPILVTQLENLRDLDISFNMISDIPGEIGRLQNLERLIIVGNQVVKFPRELADLKRLHSLDCRRNQISDLTIVCALPQLNQLSADHNYIHGLDLALGIHLTTLHVSHNDITQVSLIPVGPGMAYLLTSLDFSYAKLSSLEDVALGCLSTLRTLNLAHNSFRSLPDTLGDLGWLETLSVSDNKLDALPSSIGRLQKLEVLDAHNNSLTELPQTLWNCASLTKINVTSNFLGSWHNPPVNVSVVQEPPSPPAEKNLSVPAIENKTLTTSLTVGGNLPPLVYSLEKLYLGENRLTDDVLQPLMIFKELKVLNLSFNEIQELPPSFFRNMTQLEELYLSGNRLASIPTEDLPRLKCLSTLFLNGNKLQTLPQELCKVKKLANLDVGSNFLKYNINNWEFDWNWNFNKTLKYLNLSGNTRLQIKAEPTRSYLNHCLSTRDPVVLGHRTLSGFTDLTQLRVLGLMDVTITTTGADATVDIPDENDDRRVRTSSSTVCDMAYGIADALGRNDSLNMLDLVHEFPGRKGEAIFAMFGRAQPPSNLLPGSSANQLSKFLHDRFVSQFLSQLNALDPHRGEVIPDALRRTFLKLNQDLHDTLFSSNRKMSQSSGTTGTSTFVDSATLRSGASGIALYFVKKTMYVANVGNALAVVSRQGVAQGVSKKHDPFDRNETYRIRAAEGWVSPPGLVNDEVDVSRSFGYYYLLPVVNARPDICVWDLTDLDEFVIVANCGLWDYISYQTAVDIARTVARTERPDPMIAAQKLRDFAISYGADGSTMIMVIWVADLFKSSCSRQPTLDNIIDPQMYRTRKKDEILDRSIARLDIEVPAPVGHLALVFTDIRNSTHLWEANPGMPSAMRLHNNLLRRQLRFCGGYEVKTEGGAFMCSFPTALAAVWWALTVQVQLLHEAWPLELLECEDGKPLEDSQGRLVARGLSVRMGIHCGSPVCEPDPITYRMDYFGPMVNRSARINSSAGGGQIMCSTEIIREINAKILETELETEYLRFQPQQAIDAVKRMGVEVITIGEVKLKGLELPELLTLIYPSGLEGRQELKEGSTNPSASGSRVQFSAPQTRELGILCLRIEALASGRVFQAPSDRKASLETTSLENESKSQAPFGIFNADPDLLLPPINDHSSDMDLMLVLDSLSVRIENALSTLVEKFRPPTVDKTKFLSALLEGGTLDEGTLQHITSVLQGL